MIGVSLFHPTTTITKVHAVLNKSQDLTMGLIWLSVLPFVLCTAGLFIYPDLTPRLILGEITYGAVALGFLGGSWWERGGLLGVRSGWAVLGIYPALLGWISTMIRTIPALWVLTFSFLVIFLVELKNARTYRPVTDTLCVAALIATICLQVMLWQLKGTGLY